MRAYLLVPFLEGLRSHRNGQVETDEGADQISEIASRGALRGGCGRRSDLSSSAAVLCGGLCEGRGERAA